MLAEIILNKELASNITHPTYTGVSLIRLDQLDRKTGESKFFDSIADFKMKKIHIVDASGCEYWDFGTLERYVYSMTQILVTPSSQMRLFLEETKAITRKKIKSSSYHSENGINLSEVYIKDCLGSIVLGLRGEKDLKGKSVILNEINESIAEYLEQA